MEKHLNKRGLGSDIFHNRYFKATHVGEFLHPQRPILILPQHADKISARLSRPSCLSS